MGECQMMILKKILNYVSIALCLGLIVITVLDGFNPMMSFLTSKPSKIYIFATCAICAANGILSLIIMLVSSAVRR